MTMRFEEVTDRLSAPIHYAHHPHDRLPFNVAIPGMATVRIWQAIYGGYTWAIMYEPGVESWSDDEKRAHVGYTASYRRAEHNTSSQTIRIDGGPWPTFTSAEDACKRVWKQIRRPQ